VSLASRYRFELCDEGGQWTAAGRYADEAAVFVAFDLEVERGVRGVRVLDGDGRQLACVWPGRAAA
jgi:hypothetical protein